MSPIIPVTALVLLPAAAAAVAGLAGRRVSAVVSGLAALGSAAALLLLPAGGALGDLVALSGFGRGALWLSLAGVCLCVFALPARTDDGDAGAPWLVHLLAVGVVLLSRAPLLLLLTLLLVAAVAPRLPRPDGHQAWRRGLVIGGVLLFSGTLATQAEPRPGTDTAAAAILVLGLLMVVGALPFGLGLLAWLRQASPRLACAVTASVAPALVAVAVDSLPVFERLHLARAESPGLALAAFGTATLVGAALYSLFVRGWHELAAAGVVADLGMALVGVGSLGIAAAALTLTAMVLTRPVMFTLARTEPRPGRAQLGLVMAVLGATGMPPAIGFAARLLILAAAFRVSPPLTAAVLAGLVLEVAASARMVLSRPGAADAAEQTPWPGAGAAAAAVAAGLSLAGGIFPGLVLSRLWSLG